MRAPRVQDGSLCRRWLAQGVQCVIAQSIGIALAVCRKLNDPLGDLNTAIVVTLPALGAGAPMNTPIEIVDKLNREFNAALADPKIKARLSDMGALQFVGSPADFGKLIADEIEKWAKVIRFAGIRPQ